ncbi:hypothetical protein [Sporolactobacillus shoreicorticis]|uniref:Uncharacterized protein n=1 Tax=Sporolactobacillus shoreicorticis TaxID=1923877 RepID=A0ABW5S9K9_9BACL|nr:hypothetical protein [Sporolactobacillus shoreicorticis]
MHNDAQSSKVALFVNILSEVIFTYMENEHHDQTTIKKKEGEALE